MGTKIRPLVSADLPALFNLYCELQDTLPEVDLRVAQTQFSKHLSAARLYTPEDWYDKTADVALVAEDAGEIVAYANGRLLQKGDFLLADNTGLIQWALGRRQQKPAITAVIEAVLASLQKHNPVAVHAFNSMTTPIFFGNLGGGLPAAWPWIAQSLLDLGFAAQTPAHLMWCDLTNGDAATLKVPDGLELLNGQTFVNDYCAGLESDLNSGFYLLDEGEFVGWCGNFFAGAFIEGAGHDYVFTHWFTVQEAYQGRGLGRWLLRQSHAHARRNGAKGAMLLTDVHNFRAVSLYLTEGYRPLTLSHSFILE
ncbi:MAG: GNAT family N-acetyltransferase [Rhizobiales bacterium]|nr:GNAT family N-acetyltransferase [Hyphomicrobiales bacterium]